MDDRCLDKILSFCPYCEKQTNIIKFERTEVIENITVHCYICRCLECGQEWDDQDKPDPLEEFFYKKRLKERI